METAYDGLLERMQSLRQPAVDADDDLIDRGGAGGEAEYYDDDCDAVARDLFRAATARDPDDDAGADFCDMSDVYLTASDGEEIPACRFVLAARSRVLKKMLYGTFREAKSSTICMVGYSSHVLRAVVDYCCHNNIRMFVGRMADHLQLQQQQQQNPSGTGNSRHVDNNSNSRENGTVDEDVEDLSYATVPLVRRVVQLSKAADYLELPGLQRQADALARALINECPPLACAVYDEADPETTKSLYGYALQVIMCRPYVTLDNNNEIECEGDGGSVSAVGRHRQLRRAVAALGGVECLGPARLVELMENPNIDAGELFLFQMLRRWFEYHASVEAGESDSDSIDVAGCHIAGPDEALQVAHQCARHHIRFENIEPAVLLSDIQSCHFVPQHRIFDAVAKQALRASQDRVWSLPCRGHEQRGNAGAAAAAAAASSAGRGGTGQETSPRPRVLVEDAGCRDANGIYYLIAVLANGGVLYSKREVSCGQQFVYTLTCSLGKKSNDHGNSDGVDGSSPPLGREEDIPSQQRYECRIFSSKILTHRAVKSLLDMQSTGVVDPVFQPVVQVLSVRAPITERAGPRQKDVPMPIRKYYRVCLSDGDNYIHGTMQTDAIVAAGETSSSPSSSSSSTASNVVEFSLLKILQFELYQLNGGTRIHINQASIVGSNPGHSFGKPHRLVTSKETATASTATTAMPFPSSAVGGGGGGGHSFLSRSNSNGTDDGRHGGLRNLYSCAYSASAGAVDGQSKDSKIPRNGWQVVRPHGIEPTPTCSWIPAAVATSAASSSSSSKASSSRLANAASGTTKSKGSRPLSPAAHQSVPTPSPPSATGSSRSVRRSTSRSNSATAGRSMSEVRGSPSRSRRSRSR